jgi:predicted AlkP superfamily pyrophosphatase or phosphodiesterase
MWGHSDTSAWVKRFTALACALWFALPSANPQQTKPIRPNPATAAERPRLIVLIVVDQMRGDYVDRFRGQWKGGLRRLVDEGAWFRDATYPYAATETCVGHATISTGAFPSTHGMIANEWWDRDREIGPGKPKGGRVTCTLDTRPEGAVTNFGYSGIAVEGHDGPVRLEVPAFADELRFQNGPASRIATMSLKARASITMAGQKADSVTWLDDKTGAWTTSSAYPTASFVEEFAQTHPTAQDFGKTWSALLPDSAYFYPEVALGAVEPDGFGVAFPHPLRGKGESARPDGTYFRQWATSPYADTALTQLALAALERLELGKHSGTDFLGISYSSVDYVGHSYGPRSREIQDILARLDGDLSKLLTTLDEKVGKGRYLVAFSADHGVVPIPEDLQTQGLKGGILHLEALQEKLEAALARCNYPTPALAQVIGSDIYFSPEVAERLKQDPAGKLAVVKAARAQEGVETAYWAEELADRPPTQSALRKAYSLSYYGGRSGDLLIVPKPYWLMDSTPAGQSRRYGTGHGTPYNYDQHVPVLLMGFGIRPGEYFGRISPADIAPTLAALSAVTLVPRDGRVLAEALELPTPGSRKRAGQSAKSGVGRP